MASTSMGASFTPVHAVVNRQFCAPYPLTLYIVRKPEAMTDGNFLVIDVDGNVVLKVRGRISSHHNQRIVMDAADQPLLTLHEKRITMHSRWKVFRGDSSEDRDLLFKVKKSSMIQIKTKLEVFLAPNTKEADCDFKLKGNWFEKSWTINDGGIILAQMNKKDNFVVTVNPNVDYVFIVALVLILDGIKN